MSAKAPLSWSGFLATTVTLVAAVALHARWLPTPVLLVLVACVALRVLLRRRRGSGRVPLLIRLALVLGLAATVWSTLGSLFGREAGSALLASMLVLKLLETDTRRDARVVVTIACFLAMCSFLFNQGPLQTGAGLLVVAIALATLMQLGAIAAHDDRERSWLPYARASVLGGVRLALLAVPFALACFVLFPRLSSPMWGAPDDAFKGRTGINDSMEPGGLSSLALDDTPVMRVRFDGELPQPQDRYWRGLVFWMFDGRAWGWPDALIGFRQAPDIVALSPPIDYVVTLEPMDQRWLFLLDAPLRAPEKDSITGDFQVRHPTALSSVYQYAGRSAVQHRMQPAPLPPLQRVLALRLPGDGNPRTRELAAQWRAETQDPRELARRALALYNASFIYSLDPPLLARDSVDDFLFETRAGYCEHYASSFAFLMRAAGVPARVVVGFLGGYYNAAGGYLVIRRADAHAWTEIWIDGAGWVRYDPTAAVAPERIQEDARRALEEAGSWYERGWWSALGDRWDLAGYWWNQAVVQFSALRQRNLLQEFGVERTSADQLVVALVVAGIVALAFAALFAVPRRRDRLDPVLAAWRRACAVLGRAGIVRRAHEGPVAYAERAGTALPGLAPAIAALSSRYVALRYAANEVDGERVREFVHAVQAFRRSIGGARRKADASRP